MAEDITLSDLTSIVNDTSAVATINANNDIITEAFEDVLSRTGNSPNQMESELDMNSNRIINVVQTPVSSTEAASKGYVDSVFSTVLDSLSVPDSADAVREKISSNRAYYCRTAGVDDASRTGLSNTDGVAFNTIMFALQTILPRIDFNGYTVTFQHESANEQITIDQGNETGAWVGGGMIVIDGGGGTFTGTNWAVKVKPSILGTVQVQNATLTAPSGSAGCGFQLGNTCYGSIGPNITFGPCSYAHMYAEDYSCLVCVDDYDVTHIAPTHMEVQFRAFGFLFPETVTFASGNYVWSNAFAYADTTSFLYAGGTTWSGGTHTGVRAKANRLSLVHTSGAGNSYFPGNSIPTTATGGQYT